MTTGNVFFIGVVCTLAGLLTIADAQLTHSSAWEKRNSLLGDNLYVQLMYLYIFSNVF